MSKSCIICYRVNHFYSPPPLTTTEGGGKEDGLRSPAPSSKEQETLRKFFKLLKRYLDKPGVGDDTTTPTGFEFGESLGFPLLEQVLNAGVLSCGDCLKVVESFCDLYHKMMSAQLMLNWRLWTLKGIMSNAERVPGRVKDFRESANQLEMGELGERAMGDVIFDFKKSLVKKCRAKLQNSFPQVLLSREMSEPIQESPTPTISNIISLSQVNPNPESAKPAKKRGRKRKYRSKMIGKSPILQTAPSSQLALAPAGKKNSSDDAPVRKRGRPRKNLTGLAGISSSYKHEPQISSWGKAELAENDKTAQICDVEDNISSADIHSSLMEESYSDFETDPDLIPGSESNKDNLPIPSNYGEVVNLDANICLQQVKIESEDFPRDVQEEPLLISDSSSNLINNGMNLVSFEEKFEHHASGKNLKPPPTHSAVSEDTDNTYEYFPDLTDHNDDDNPGPLQSESEDSESDYYHDDDDDDFDCSRTPTPKSLQQGEDESPETTAQAQSRASRSSKSLKYKPGRKPKAKTVSKSRKIYQCDFDNCHKKFLTLEYFNYHQKLHGNFNCDVCAMTHSYAPDLALHELRAHYSPTDDDTEVPIPGAKKMTPIRCPRPNCSFTCRASYKGLFAQHYLLDHMKLDLSEESSCCICSKVFTAGVSDHEHAYRYCRKAQRRHYDRQHNLSNLKQGDVAQNCDLADCQAYFLNAVQLRLHKEDVHKIKEDHVCPDCNRRFTRHRTLSEHRASKHLPKEALIHPCTLACCKRRFLTKQDLENHVKFTHAEKKSARKCQKCGKSFMGKSALISHMRSHDANKSKPVCEICGKEYKDRDALSAHKLTHTSPESWKFLCTKCPKKCRTQQRLDVHMRMHTQEKPFSCDLCGLKYAHRHNLKIHMKASHKGAAWQRDIRESRPRTTPDDLSDTDQEHN